MIELGKAIVCEAAWFGWTCGYLVNETRHEICSHFFLKWMNENTTCHAPLPLNNLERVT